MIHQNGIPDENKFSVVGEDSLNLDIEKFLEILRKSIPWIIIIVAICISAAYLYIRYTPEEFESRSVLQLDIKSEASVFGFKSFDEGINNISKEIEFLKSNLFLSKVAEEIKQDVSIYARGEFLHNERYKNNPFGLYYEIYNDSYYDRNFEVVLLNKDEFSFNPTPESKELTEKKYRYGDTIKTDYFKFVISLTEHFNERDDHKYYFFRVNSKSAQTSYLSRNITVQPLDFKANTITLSFKDNNKQKARDMVTALDTLYLYYSQQEKNKENNQKITFLNEQLKATEEKLSELETYFENFTITYKTTSLDANLSKTIAILESLDSQRLNIQHRLKLVNEVHEKVLHEDNFVLSTVELSQLPQNIATEIQNYEKLLQEKRKLESSYKPGTFVFQKVLSELEYAGQRITLYVSEYKNSLLLQMADLRKRQSELETRFATLPAKKTEYTKTERYYNLYEEFYLSLIKNKAQFELAEAGTTTDYKILSPASSPSGPIAPNGVLYYSISAVIGILLSVMFIGVRYLLHNKISGQRELEHLAQYPVLGSIPYYPKEKSENSRLIVDKYPKSNLSEAFRALRTNMEFITSRDSKPVICVTSSTSGEGKTFVAVNLGGIISMLKTRVIILDLDMRKPRLQKVFYNNMASVGMSTILIGKTNVEECIQKTSIENLDYIASGPIPPNPAELISSEYFEKTLETLKKKYDTVIIDTPPVGLVTDGIIAMRKATIPLFIVRSDFSKKNFVKAIHKLIKIHQLNNAGFIINSVKKTGSYGYGYGKNSYGYYEEDENATIFKLKGLLGL